MGELKGEVAFMIHKRIPCKLAWMERLFESLFLHSWWVWLFFFFCFCLYLPTIKKRNEEIAYFQSRYNSLEEEKLAALNEREDLLLRLHSQSDPAWIEQVLIRELGVVPDGYLKVHFKKK